MAGGAEWTTYRRRVAFVVNPDVERSQLAYCRLKGLARAVLLEFLNARAVNKPELGVRLVKALDQFEASWCPREMKRRWRNR